MGPLQAVTVTVRFITRRRQIAGDVTEPRKRFCHRTAREREDQDFSASLEIVGVFLRALSIGRRRRGVIGFSGALETIGADVWIF